MSFTEKLQSALVPDSNGNVEFSWINARYNGLNLLPDEVRVQEADTYVFEAFSAGGEMALRLDAAMEGKTCDLKFSSSSLVRDYEEHTGRKITEEPTANLPANVRQATVQKFCQDKGLLATSANWEGERRIKFTSCFRPPSARFDGIANLIRQGKPVVGCFPVHEDFRTLGPGRIYSYKKPLVGIDKQSYCHYVLFIGYGYDATGVPYLVFLNSYGTGWGDNGFGRVYFADTYKDWFYHLKVKVPKVINTNTSSSSYPAPLPAESNEEAARPRQRRRLNKDDTTTSSAGHQAPDAGDG